MQIYIKQPIQPWQNYTHFTLLGHQRLAEIMQVIRENQLFQQRMWI